MTTRSTRRSFLARSACGAAVASAGLGLARLTAAAEEKADSSELPRLVRAFETGTRRPRGVAARNGRVYVAADRRVVGFDVQGKAEVEIALERPVRAVAVLDDDDLLVALMHHVERFSASGKRRAKWEGLGEDSLISSLAAVRETVYVADAAAGVVHRYRTTGEQTGVIRRESHGFSAPAEFFAVAASADGLHVTQPRRHRVERFSNAGELVSAFGARSRELSGFSGCCNPVGLTVLGDGRIATAERGVPRVKLYRADGELVAELLGPESFEENAQASAEDDGYGCSSGGLDLASDADRIYVLDRVTGRVAVLA